MSNTYRKPDTYKYYLDKNVNISTQALTCINCKLAVIAEFNPELNTTELYEFDPYFDHNRKILHRHQADARTRARVMECVAVEKRLLHDKDPNDYHYSARRGMN